jgi:hypothetical protein
MSLHEQIAARFTTDDTKILLLTLADHIEALEAKVEKLELTIKPKERKLRNMSIESTLNELLEAGCGPITIGKPPANSGPPNSMPNFFVTAPHGIPTGPMGNNIEMKIQGIGDTIGQAVDKFRESFEKVDKLKVKPSGVLVPLPNARIPKIARS